MPQMGLKLKALACSMLVVGGVSLVYVSAAQGEATANWRVNGVNVNSTLLPEVQVKELENKIATLLFTTKGGTKVRILCKVIHFAQAKYRTNGSISSFSFKGLECTVDLNGTESTNCKPHTTGEASGTIKSKSLLGLLILASAGVPVVQVKPETGTSLMNIELGELCAIGETIPVEGVLNLKDCKGTIATEQVDHLFEEGPGSTLTALGQPTSLDGSAILALTGVHAGLKYSGLAG